MIDDDRIGFALETQTRPVYGDSVLRQRRPTTPGWSPTSWRTSGSATASRSTTGSDIWLNEGFATYAEWLWDEHDGGRHRAGAASTSQYAGATARSGRRRRASRARSSIFSRLGLPARRDDRARAAADRRRRGVLPASLKTWAAEKRNGNATTAEFIAAGRAGLRQGRCDALFDAWLFGKTDARRRRSRLDACVSLSHGPVGWARQERLRPPGAQRREELPAHRRELLAEVAAAAADRAPGQPDQRERLRAQVCAGRTRSRSACARGRRRSACRRAPRAPASSFAGSVGQAPGQDHLGQQRLDRAAAGAAAGRSRRR